MLLAVAERRHGQQRSSFLGGNLKMQDDMVSYKGGLVFVTYIGRE
jgi:hypothetical protein